MKLRWCLLSLVVSAVALAGLTSPLAASDLANATWRSWWGRPLAVAVNPADDSAWAAVGSSLYHLAPDGGILLRTDSYWAPQDVAVNAADGSCWVADSNHNQVVHVSKYGEELWRGSGFAYPVFISVNPADGSVWVGQTGRSFATPEVVGEPEVIHLAADGTVLWRTDAYSPGALAVSPADGACWLRDYNTARLVRLSPAGEETVALDGFTPSGQIGVGSPDGSVWVSDFAHFELVHLSACGDELWRGGSFVAPGHVAVSPVDGSVWVMALDATGLADEVVHLSASGSELWRQGGFSEPEGYAPLAPIPSDGSVWVADAGGAGLVRLGADGAELVRLQDFDYPVSVAVNAIDHTTWVADQDRRRMVQLRPDGRELRAVTGRAPVALAVNAHDGSVWEVDFDQSVARFSSDGTELWRRESLTSMPTIAVNPTDGSGWVGALDTVTHLSASGEELWNGTGFAYVSSLTVDPKDGSCWVGIHDSPPESGTIRGSVVHLTADGREIWRSSEGAFSDPCALSVDPRDQSVRIGDYLRGEVVCLAPWGAEEWRTSVGYVPRSVAVDPSDGACWVALYGSSSVVLLSAHGAILWRGDAFSNPLSVSVDPSDGACWVADTGDAQVVRLERFRFADVSMVNWAADDIYACATAGIVTGYVNGDYHPEYKVTRDQMAVYLARALAGGEAAVPAGPSQSPFTDVAADQWAYRHIAYCAEMGVVEGYPGGNYRPGQVVNRAQMAVYIARAIADPVGEEGLAGYEGPRFQTFADVSPAHWAYRYIEYIAARGVAQGFSSGLYLPEAAVTRDQMAAYVARAFLQ